MKKHLPLIALLGCSDYELYPQAIFTEKGFSEDTTEIDTGYEENTEFLDAGFEDDTDDHVTYNPCDPYDGWAFAPEESEHPGCVGIEGLAQFDGEDKIMTQIYVGSCDLPSEESWPTFYLGGENELNGVAMSASSQGECGNREEGYLSVGFSDKWMGPEELQGLEWHVEVHITTEGDDSNLNGMLQYEGWCPDDAVSIGDCTALLRR